MEGSSSSDDKEKKEKEPSKPVSNKAKPRKSSDVMMAELARKHSAMALQISQFEDLKRASFANQIERQLRQLPSPSAMAIMEDAMRQESYMKEFRSIDSFRSLCADSFGETARLAYETARNIPESLLRPELPGYEGYEAVRRTHLDSALFHDTIGDLSILQNSWMNAIDISPLESVIDDIKASLSTSAIDFFRISSDFRQAYAELPCQEITVVSDERIMCAGAAYDISEIEAVLREKLETAGFMGEGPIGEKQFAILLSEIRKSRDPSLKSIIYNFLISLFVSIIILYAAPHLQNIQKGSSSKNRTAATKIIEREVPKIACDKDTLCDYRFVTADVLKVRSRNSQNSQLIGRLDFGSLVKVIKKKKNWTLVEWKDKKNNLVIQGWVFTRYLKKFKM